MRRGGSGPQWVQKDVGLPRNVLRSSPPGVEGMVATPVGVCGIYPPRRSSVPSPRSFRRKSKSIHRRRSA